MTASPAYRRILVLGGARSGKSAYAERLAGELGEPVLYVATAVAGDAEMVARIRWHQAQRPGQWRTVEAPLRVAEATAAALADARTVVVEDLTLLLSNLVAGPEHDAPGHDPVETLAAEQVAVDEVRALFRLPAHVVLVSNEVGMGLVPAYALGRAFRDALGRVNQAAAAWADEVYFLVAGLPSRLKPPASPR